MKIHKGQVIMKLSYCRGHGKLQTNCSMPCNSFSLQIFQQYSAKYSSSTELQNCGFPTKGGKQRKNEHSQVHLRTVLLSNNFKMISTRIFTKDKELKAAL